MAPGEKIILLCEDTLEGFCTAFYDGWKLCPTPPRPGKDLSGGDPQTLKREKTLSGGDPKPGQALPPKPGEERLQILACGGAQPELFCTYRQIKTDPEKAEKVLRTVKRRLGIQVFEHVCYALASCHPCKGTAVFYVLKRGFAGGGADRDVMDALADPFVNLTAKLRVKVWHERHRYLGFVRFEELGGGVLFSRISPENNILELLGPHFANRFPLENWMIYDERRHKALLHPAGGEWEVRSGIPGEKVRSGISGEESGRENAPDTGAIRRKADGSGGFYEDLWKAFCATITIEERRKPRLQTGFLPRKYRSNMTEFL